MAEGVGFPVGLASAFSNHDKPGFGLKENQTGSPKWRRRLELGIEGERSQRRPNFHSLPHRSDRPDLRKLKAKPVREEEQIRGNDTEERMRKAQKFSENWWNRNVQYRNWE